MLLAAIGLAMAYTNSVESGGAAARCRDDLHPRPHVGRASPSSCSSLATAFDYRWLKTLAWPLYALHLGLLVLTLAIGDGVGGSARWIALGPFSSSSASSPRSS